MKKDVFDMFVFIVLILMAILVLSLDCFGYFYGIAVFLYLGPRFENSTDRINYGREGANHKLVVWDIISLIFIALEIITYIFLKP